MSLEPLVECGLTASELVKAMLLGERLGLPVRHALLGAEDARPGEELLEPGVVLRWAVEELDEAIPAFSLEDERRPIGEHALGLEDRSVDYEVSQRRMRRFGRLANEAVGIRLDAEVPALLGPCHTETYCTHSFRTTELVVRSSLTNRMREIVHDVQTWSVFSPEKGYAFNGYAITTEGGTVLIDPPEPVEEGWNAVDLLEPFAGVWITNRNHSRAAAAFRERYGIEVVAHEADADRLEAGADRTARGGERLPGEIELIHVPGKSPGEIAFHVPRSRALVVGDVVIGVPEGELSTYPDEVIDDREELQRSTVRLLEYDFDALLLCDGEPLTEGGKEKLREFVEAPRD